MPYGIDFKLIYNDGKEPFIRKGAACFAPIIFVYGNEYNRENSTHLIYEIEDKLAAENGSKIQSLVYIKDLESMGIFHFTQTPEEVVESGNWIADMNFPRDQVFGTATAIRYLDEYPWIVKNYLLLKQMMPNEDKWKLLQLAHCCRHEKLADRCPMPGGHGLLQSFYGLERYKSVDEILEAFSKQPRANEPKWSGTNLFETFSIGNKDLNAIRKYSDCKTAKQIIDLHILMDKENQNAKKSVA